MGLRMDRQPGFLGSQTVVNSVLKPSQYAINISEGRVNNLQDLTMVTDVEIIFNVYGRFYSSSTNVSLLLCHYRNNSNPLLTNEVVKYRGWIIRANLNSPVNSST